MLEFEPEDEIRFPHKDVTEAIIGSAFEVYNHLGYGFLHRVYQRSLEAELTRLQRGAGEADNRPLQRHRCRGLRCRFSC